MTKIQVFLFWVLIGFILAGAIRRICMETFSYIPTAEDIRQFENVQKSYIRGATQPLQP